MTDSIDLNHPHAMWHSTEVATLCVALGLHLHLGFPVAQEVTGLGWETSVLGKVERGVAQGPQPVLSKKPYPQRRTHVFLLSLMVSGCPPASLPGLTKSRIFLL